MESPRVGRLVRYKTKILGQILSEWRAGTVKFLFWSLDCKAVELNDGSIFFPGLDEPWEYIDND